MERTLDLHIHQHYGTINSDTHHHGTNTRHSNTSTSWNTPHQPLDIITPLHTSLQLANVTAQCHSTK